jgi:TolB protein
LKFSGILLLILWFTLAPVRAEELTIEITKGVEMTSAPIAIVPFAESSQAPENLATIIATDLRRSGRFEPVQPRAYQPAPAELGQINLADIRTLGADHVVVGQVQPNGGGYAIRFQLGDVLDGRELLGNAFQVNSDELRRVAHHIADLIYEKLTGERGAFATRVAYITAEPNPDGTPAAYALMVADADGHQPRVILRSVDPLMSARWSPDGNRLAYVSFEGRKPKIVVQDVYAGDRRIVTDFPGINGAPAWSPDGRRLAFTLSKDGNPEIYVADLDNPYPVRLTDHNGIDTEPVWSPDGSQIVFTSDRGGSPQLYRISVTGGPAERLTFEGDYNAAAAFSPDGRTLTMVQRRSGKFHIALMDLQTRKVRLLTPGGLDESPTFAPNGRMILYATTQGGRQVLAAVSVDGRVRQTLGLRNSGVREPTWAPYDR